jgi:hypothetical protein
MIQIGNIVESTIIKPIVAYDICIMELRAIIRLISFSLNAIKLVYKKLKILTVSNIGLKLSKANGKN